MRAVYGDLVEGVGQIKSQGLDHKPLLLVLVILKVVVVLWGAATLFLLPCFFGQQPVTYFCPCWTEVSSFLTRVSQTTKELSFALYNFSEKSQSHGVACLYGRIRKAHNTDEHPQVRNFKSCFVFFLSCFFICWNIFLHFFPSLYPFLSLNMLYCISERSYNLESRFWLIFMQIQPDSFVCFRFCIV